MAPGPLGISRARESSGTAWLPDDSPMYALHGMSGSWELMLHGIATVHWVDEGGDRVDGALDATNWVMGMGRRALGGGDLTLRAMASLDPWTAGECGYPNLLASGESCDGEPLVDRQHPHDLIMELAAVYERPLGEDLALQLYGGPAGEPALGPVAFPHRISALGNPLAPVGHHWLDSTHIAFGVATAGLYGRAWKIEASAFNGREPDEERHDLDLAALDSWSGRIWWTPGPGWALQASHGRLEEAEAPHEEDAGGGRIDVTRTTASITYHYPLANAGHWATTAAWGRNEEEGRATDAFLVETNVNLSQRGVLFGRWETAEKTAVDLRLAEAGVPVEHEESFTVSRLIAGYLRQLPKVGGLAPGLGAGVSIGLVPDELEVAYGGSPVLGFLLFARVRPAPAPHEEHGAATEASSRR